MIDSQLELLASVAEDLYEPSHLISGSGVGWFLDLDLKKMVMVNRGVEIFPIEVFDDKNMIARAPYNFIIIPNNEIIEIGYN